MEFPIHGYVAPGFEPVREVFEKNFTEDVDVGAGFCVVGADEVLVDLWGGYSDRDCTQPWTRETLVNLYSTTKGLGAITVAAVTATTELDYDQPVSRYWPELRAGQGGLTVGQLLSHQGGLCGVDEEITAQDLYDWDKMVALLEQQEPHWPPGTAAGYHAIVWGYLAGELVRRVTGRTLGQIFREEIASPLSADCHIGLPEAEHHRVADMIGPNHARIQPDLAALMAMKMPPLYKVALQNPSIRPFQDASSAAWRKAEIAAANGQGNAAGIAAIYAACANGGTLNGTRITASDAIDGMVQLEVADEEDLVLGRAMRRGRGVILNTEGGYGPGDASYGHAGAGGSVGFADPARGLGVAYAMNQMQMNLDDDTRSGRLINALYACLDR